MSEPILYKNTDVSIRINVGTGWSIDDVEEMHVTLTKVGATSSVTFSGENVIVGPSHITVEIPRSGGITTSGIYAVKMIYIDVEGNERGLTPSIRFLSFHD